METLKCRDRVTLNCGDPALGLSLKDGVSEMMFSDGRAAEPWSPSRSRRAGGLSVTQL